jgi:pimeloyl-ACP methyl ester carboxylesterase
VQEALAWAGIDTFAPSLLGYGRSTTFEAALDDPANASLRPHDGTCPYAEGCDSTPNPVFQLDQQGSDILTNPLGGQRLPHTIAARFARTDVWVRDIRQVIEDAIARAQPTDGKVALVGYSLGPLRVGRALDAVKLPEIVQRVSRVAFLSPIFGGPAEETPPAGGFVTFPLSLTERSEVVDSDRMPNTERDAVCAGHRVEGGTDYAWAQLMDHDVVGRSWGGTDPADPAGVLRSPTFSAYGWNTDVAAQLIPPTLVMQGLDDTDIPGGTGNAPAIYHALPTSMTNKVLVQLDCATHAMMWEGCSNAPRCSPASGIPYGGPPDRPWAGPHSTIKAALIEWITNGTFDGAGLGTSVVDASGVARPDRT